MYGYFCYLYNDLVLYKDNSNCLSSTIDWLYRWQLPTEWSLSYFKQVLHHSLVVDTLKHWCNVRVHLISIILQRLTNKSVTSGNVAIDAHREARVESPPPPPPSKNVCYFSSLDGVVFSLWLDFFLFFYILVPFFGLALPLQTFLRATMKITTCLLYYHQSNGFLLLTSVALRELNVHVHNTCNCTMYMHVTVHVSVACCLSRHAWQHLQYHRQCYCCNID